MTRLERIAPWIGVAALLFAFSTWLAFPYGGGGPLARALLAMWLGVAALALGWWRGAVSGAGSLEGRYALPVSVAVVGMLVAPMLLTTRALVPVFSLLFPPGSTFFDDLPTLVGQAILVPLGVVADGWTLVVLVTSLPLAHALSRELPRTGFGRGTRLVMVLLGLTLLLADAFWGWLWRAEDLEVPALWALASAITFLPAAVIGWGVWRSGQDAAVPAQRRLIAAAAYLAIGAAPAVAGIVLLTDRWPWLLIPAAAAVGAAVLVIKIAVLPLSRLAGAAVSQRDLVVSAAESERVRLASELHDGPLADLSLLIQDLDDRRDADGAATARAIATDLRGIGSDLRLPILDDLGVGPALDWLVARSRQRFGQQVDLELGPTERLPAAVELAVYRIAQEAIRNAIEHGQAPVSVRYRSDGSRAELEIQDAGPGLDEPTRARALESGRLGLVSMAQRAETIGAELTLTERSGGGTRVRLTWVGPAAAPSSAWA